MDVVAAQESQAKAEAVDFQTDPSRYKHWRLAFDGPVATLTMDVAEDGGIRPGYKLKLNSYDLGVDIELHDALQRIRFEHPEIRSVIITSAKNRIFCSGANIYMLGLSSHAWKVNFCKFTNETRNGIEDASAHSGLKFLAACNGTTAGGGYELALACDEIILVDDRSSAVSLPELPLLGVLPGTGGLTRITDKRKVRRDHADMFCTNADGVRGQRAKEWRLVDEAVKPQQFAEHITQRALKLAEQSNRPANTKGVNLSRLNKTSDEAGLHYGFVDVQCDRVARTATITVRTPESVSENSLEKAIAAGANWWPLQMARELDDAILTLRASELDLGLWIIKASGNPDAVLAIGEADQLGPPLDRDAEGLQPLDQQPLVLVLGKDLQERVGRQAGPHGRQRNLGLRLPPDPEIDCRNLVALGDHGIRKIELPVEFKRARLYRERPRGRAWLGGLVDDAHFDAEPG